MGQMIVKQPNGNFARWSGIVDSFTHLDMTEAEALETLQQQCRATDTEARRALHRAKIDADPYDNRNKPRALLTRWKECIETIALLHGATSALRILHGDATGQWYQTSDYVCWGLSYKAMTSLYDEVKDSIVLQEEIR